ncbi:type IV pilus modification protein PilV [Endozoicomonas sp. ONNA2]|uniref:type IV pilus modification protein PilV n=1 Tax=Endozoicomonas sp. ONNA2 TaxID=2828741 RepID=UPI0021485EE2|nr:type IV pilus modification protein PilV [Endozoicomonas sp. ONNA2]
MTNSVRPITTQPGLLSLAAAHKAGWHFGPLRQKGMGLVEVMIGVLIFAGGVMAVTGMQSQAIRANHDAIQRSQAVWMANATAELMRLNSNGLPTYVRESSATANLGSFCQGFPPNCTGATCTADLMASFDLYGLMCSSANTMIEPKMDIQCDGSCGPTDKVTILVSWGARGSEKGVLADRQQVELRYNRN